MHAVRKNRYVILAKDIEKGYKANVKKEDTDFAFYQWLGFLRIFFSLSLLLNNHVSPVTDGVGSLSCTNLFNPLASIRIHSFLYKEYR